MGTWVTTTHLSRNTTERGKPQGVRQKNNPKEKSKEKTTGAERGNNLSK